MAVNELIGLYIFYFISSTCDTRINISNKGGIRMKARVPIKFFSQAYINSITCLTTSLIKINIQNVINKLKERERERERERMMINRISYGNEKKI